MVESNVWTDVDIEEQLDTEVDESYESMWKIIIHNDDVTPFDFVIDILQKIFELQAPEAEYVTVVAHTMGQAYVTTLPQTEAQKRVGKAHFAASLEGYPLHFTIEPV